MMTGSETEKGFVKIPLQVEIEFGKGYHVRVYYTAIGVNVRKFKVALKPLRRIFFNFAKSCILTC